MASGAVADGQDEFHTTIMDGRLEKGMRPFSSSKMVTEHLPAQRLTES